MSDQVQDLSAAQLLAEIQKGVRMFSVFQNGEAMLKGLVTLEQDIKDTQARHDALKASESEWQAKKKAALDSADLTAKTAQKVLDDAHEEAKRILEDARATRQTLIQKAKKEGQDMITDARADAAGHKAAANAAKEAHDDLQDKIKAGKAELEKTNSALAAAKESVKKLMGG